MAEHTPDARGSWAVQDEGLDHTQDMFCASQNSDSVEGHHDVVSEQVLALSVAAPPPEEIEAAEPCSAQHTHPKGVAGGVDSSRSYEHERNCEVQDLESFVNKSLSERGNEALNPDHFNLPPVTEADQRPPITKESLSGLDVTTIIQNPQMRYDLNFDKDARFYPGYENTQGRLQRKKSEEYWRALSVELALYMECSFKPHSECLLQTPSYREMATRLPEFFTTLHDILRTLVRDEDWDSIDETLNVDLIMQQLRKGIYDLVSLNNWLGSLLKRSCSPLRDEEVEVVVDIMNEAVRMSKPMELSKGLERLLGLLETMKLDIANHQIRFLRLLMINDSIDYVREHFFKRMPANHLIQARQRFEQAMSRGWREQYVEDSERSAEWHKSPEEHKIKLFGSAVRDMVRPIVRKLEPVSFEFDQNRFLDLGAEYKLLLFDRQMSHVFHRTLRFYGFQGHPPSGARSILLSRISKLESLAHCTKEDIVLEIAIAAGVCCQLGRFPSIEEMTCVRRYFDAVTDPSDGSFKDVEQSLSHDLDNYLDEEILAIRSLPPLQIANRYQPDHLPLPGPSQSLEAQRLKTLAERIAHIAVLNWRIWAPILCLRHTDVRFETTSDGRRSSSPDSNASLRTETFASQGSSSEEGLTMPLPDGAAINDNEASITR